MLRFLFRSALHPFADQDLLAAALFGCLAGLLLALSFRLFSKRAATSALRRKMWAHVLELRLFGDEPRLAFASLLAIARVNALLLAYALPPLMAAAPLVALLVFHLNDFFWRTPLVSGAPAVLTVRVGRGASLAGIALHLPAWIQLDAPPVSLPARGETSWRLRPTAPASGVCTISLAGETILKQLDARPGSHYSGRVRARPLLDSLMHPAEDRLPEGPVERVWVAPVPAPLTLAGLTLDWREWFACAASFSAWLFSLLFGRLGGLRLLQLFSRRL